MHSRSVPEHDHILLMERLSSIVCSSSYVRSWPIKDIGKVRLGSYQGGDPLLRTASLRMALTTGLMGSQTRMD